MLHMKAILTAAWAAVLFISAMPAAAAAPGYEARSVKVDYSDLDLTRAQGVSTLQHRVSGAIHRVCDDADFTLRAKMQQHACAAMARNTANNDVEQAIASARKQRWAGSIGTAPAGKTGKSISTTAKQAPLSRFGDAGTASGGLGKPAGAGVAGGAFGKPLMSTRQQPWAGHKSIPQR
jgi:UrcA family protein